MKSFEPTLPIVTTIIRNPRDWIAARQRAQLISSLLGFGPQDQTRISTAVSEIARNAFEYGNGGKVEFIAGTAAPQSLIVRISDHGPGIAALDEILAGRYRSPKGLGIGITGSRTLMDEFTVDTHAGEGTTVQFRKWLPSKAARMTPELLARVAEDLNRRPVDALEEAHQYNRDLLLTLEELHRVNRELEAANEAKDQFLATVSHEMRSPMTSILGWMEMLKASDLDETTKAEGLVAIESAARMQARLVDDVLDAARAKAGKLALESTAVDMREVIDAVCLAVQPAAAAKPVTLTCGFDAETLPVHGDSIRLQQILWNLVSNAIKFTPANGAITLSATSSGEQVTVTVTDTGEGIADDLLPHVFERFRQGKDSRRHGGLGLGLAIVRHLVELHGGAISVASDGPGKGACFTVRLPRRRS